MRSLNEARIKGQIEVAPGDLPFLAPVDLISFQSNQAGWNVRNRHRPLRMRIRLLLIFTLAVAAVARAATPSYDVVIYGGTSAGIAAAIQSARMGRTAVL